MIFVKVKVRLQGPKVAGLKRAIGWSQRKVMGALKKERAIFKEFDLRTLPFTRAVSDLILQMEIRQVRKQ